MTTHVTVIATPIISVAVWGSRLILPLLDLVKAERARHQNVDVVVSVVRVLSAVGEVRVVDLVAPELELIVAGLVVISGREIEARSHNIEDERTIRIRSVLVNATLCACV